MMIRIRTGNDREVIREGNFKTTTEVVWYGAHIATKLADGVWRLYSSKSVTTEWPPARPEDQEKFNAIEPLKGTPMPRREPDPQVHYQMNRAPEPGTGPDEGERGE